MYKSDPSNPTRINNLQKLGLSLPAERRRPFCNSLSSSSTKKPFFTLKESRNKPSGNSVFHWKYINNNSGECGVFKTVCHFNAPLLCGIFNLSHIISILSSFVDRFPHLILGLPWQTRFILRYYYREIGGGVVRVRFRNGDHGALGCIIYLRSAPSESFAAVVINFSAAIKLDLYVIPFFQLVARPSLDGHLTSNVSAYQHCFDARVHLMLMLMQRSPLGLSLGQEKVANGFPTPSSLIWLIFYLLSSKLWLFENNSKQLYNSLLV